MFYFYIKALSQEHPLGQDSVTGWPTFLHSFTAPSWTEARRYTRSFLSDGQSVTFRNAGHGTEDQFVCIDGEERYMLEVGRRVPNF